MPARSIIILALGIVIAVGTALSLKSRMSAEEAKSETKVLVAAADIAAGSFVRADYHLGMADWPEKNITESMLTSATTTPTDFEGAVARRSIAKGEAITKSTLVKSSEGGFLSAVLEPGKRAVSIAVDATSGNAGFIFPGDKVDLLLTHQIQVGQQTERASETFIEDVRVLAVDQSLDNPENKAMLAKTVTLEVTPKEAEEINVAKDLGKISLSLRSLARNLDGAEAAPENMDEVLQSADGLMPESGVTRDTDVSRVITAPDAAGSRVRLIRGSEQPVDVEFGAEGARHGSGE